MVERESPVPVLAGIRTAGLLLAGTLALSVVPHLAFAAVGWNLACDEMARELKSADVSVESLAVSPVDHMSDDHGTVAVANAGDATAPLLFLTPRVAHILEEIFDESDTQAVSPMERVRRIMLAANAASRDAAEVPPAKPSGGDGDRPNEAVPDFDTAILSAPMTDTFHDVDTLPQFQRQMYRNDI